MSPKLLRIENSSQSYSTSSISAYGTDDRVGPTQQAGVPARLEHEISQQSGVSVGFSSFSRPVSIPTVQTTSSVTSFLVVVVQSLYYDSRLRPRRIRLPYHILIMNQDEQVVYDSKIDCSCDLVALSTEQNPPELVGGIPAAENPKQFHREHYTVFSHMRERVLVVSDITQSLAVLRYKITNRYIRDVTRSPFMHNYVSVDTRNRVNSGEPLPITAVIEEMIGEKFEKSPRLQAAQLVKCYKKCRSEWESVLLLTRDDELNIIPNPINRDCFVNLLEVTPAFGFCVGLRSELVIPDPHDEHSRNFSGRGRAPHRAPRGSYQHTRIITLSVT